MIPKIPDLFEQIFAKGSLFLALVGWIALVLAEAGWFSITRLALILCGLLLLGIWRQKQRAKPLLPHFSLPLTSFRPRQLVRPFLLLLWLLLAGFLFLRPHEMILGGADAGVYVSIGANIAHTGSLLIDDPLLAQLPPALHPILLRELPPIENAPFYQFAGFYVPTEPDGRVIPQFYPLYPVWLAIVQSIGGVKAGLLTTGVWGMLGCLAVFLLVRRMAGEKAASLALLGLTLNGLQIWFSRYSTTETLTQFWLWTGMWALAVWWEDRPQRKSWGFLAAMAWGSMLLTRIDLYFLLSVPAFLLFWQWWQHSWHKSDLFYYLPLLFLTAHSFIHAFWQSRPYFLNTFGYGLNLLQNYPFIPIGLGLLLVGMGWGIRHKRGQNWIDRKRWQHWLKVGMSAGILLLALYAWWIRPQLEVGRLLPNWYDGQTILRSDSQTLHWLSWYLSPLGLWLGILGSCWLILWQPTNHKFPLKGIVLFIGLFFAFLYLWRLYNNPTQVYAMRRYVPAVLPFFTLTAALLLTQLAAQLPHHSTLLTTLFALVWLTNLLQAGQGLLFQVDARSLVNQFQTIANQLPPNSILLFNDQAPVGLGDFAGTPLQYLHHHHAFTLRTLPSPDLTPQLLQIINQWQKTGHTTYWIGDPSWLINQNIPITPYQTFTLTAQTLEGSLNRRPQAIITQTWTIPLVEINP